MNFPDYEEQKTHCQEIASRLTKEFLSDPAWQELDCPDKSPALREKLYFALTFLRSGDTEAVAYANRIIQNSKYIECTFSPMLVLQMVFKYRHLLEEKSIQTIRSYLDWEIENEAKPEMAYVGVNDNFPSMAACALLLGGQFLERPELCQLGLERLKQFRALLTRRGVASEYNSPTYLPIQLISMSEIAHLSDLSEAKEIALDCEARIWTDFFGHLHPSTWQPAGPYSRAYMDDSMVHVSLMRCTLYAVFGDSMPANIYDTLLDINPDNAKINNHSTSEFTKNNLVWLMDTQYDCPPEVFQLALHKQLPYTFQATTEFSGSRDDPANGFTGAVLTGQAEEIYEYGAGNGSICTYMTEDYALGTANHQFHNGIQTDAFHILYRCNETVQAQKDIRAIFSRYLFNEREPHAEDVLLGDQGRTLCFQKDNTALVLYKPKTLFCTNVTSMKLSVVIPVQFGLPEEIWLGSRRLTESQGESYEPCSVYIKDGPVYLAFHPCILTDHGRTSAVKVQVQNDYLLLSFYNYEGPERDFTEKECLLTGNGFAAEVHSQEDYSDFAAFRESAENFTLTDTTQQSIHSRQTVIRHTKFQNAHCSLECEYSPVSEGIKYISIDGQVPENKKIDITGFPCHTLPFC